MRKQRKIFLFLLLVVVVFSASSCSKTAENEHLPEYCQTYSSFTSFASKDFYDLLIEQDIEIDKRHYLEAIAAISLEFVVDDPSRDIDLSGIQCFQNLTDISLTGQSFRDLSPISALTNIQSIELVGTSVVSIDSFKNLSKIKSLVISDTYTLQSVDGVEEMTKLTNLDLSNNGIVNIEGLNNLINLTTLYLNNNEIIEFPSINQLDQLETLDISNNNISILGDDLSGLTALKTLNAANNQICDISALDDLIRLETLNLSSNNLGCLGVSPNFDSLENAPNLTELRLDHNGLTSIAGLEGRDISLEILYLNDNELTTLSPIAEYTNIVELYIQNNNIIEIDDLSNMTGLTTIDLSHNQIESFESLLAIENLIEVDLSFNKIDEIPDISTSWPDLTTLDLSSNGLSITNGVMGHPTLETLYLYNNGLTELNGISYLPNLDTLVLFDEELESELDEDDRNPNEIQFIRNCFNEVPELVLQTDNVLDFGFAFEDDLEIYNSINGITDITTVRFENMNIKVIDENSLNLPNLQIILLAGNKLEDIQFVLGNPRLAQVDVSANPVSNLLVFSGVNTTDLDNLVDIKATDIDEDNNLINAFIELPSIETINLDNTRIVTINNSFNDLSTLTEIYVPGTYLVSIIDSFNHLFDTYSQYNVFNLKEGRIGHISGSFNYGNYHLMDFTVQTTIPIATIIEDSFNYLTIEDDQGIVLSNANFETISNSFNHLTAVQLDISSSNVHVITDAFIESTIETIHLEENYIQDIPSLNQITSVDRLYLNKNLLTTLAFLNGIPDITYLNISDQVTKTQPAVATLVSFDGVNNMPTLTTLLYGNLGVSEINGLQNIGITSFSITLEQNYGILIDLIDVDSFTGTPLTSLNLNGHELDDISFLGNLDSLTSLDIGVDLLDLSGFQGLTIETTLEELSIQNKQAITDFVYLSGYDAISDITIDSPLTTTIHNFDGFEALENITMNYALISSITNSFNNMPSFDEGQDFLVNEFSSLENIENSFDMYGSINHTSSIQITPDFLNIENSFNNVVHLIITDNNGETVPGFDTFSFDNVEWITMEYADYDLFSFLNGYNSLHTLTIDNLDVDITDLNNPSITSLDIQVLDSTVDVLVVTLSSTAEVEFTSSRIGAISVTSNAKTYSINAVNADITINSTATTLLLNLDVDTLVLTDDTVTNIELASFETNTTTFNTNLLATITRSNTTVQNATTFTVNSTVIAVDYNTRANTLIINNNSVTTYDVVVFGGTAQINNTQAILSMTVSANQLDILYNTLEQVSLDGTVGTVYVSSTNLDTFNSTADITVLNLESNEPILSVGGSNITNLYLTNNAITNLSLNTPGTITNLSTTNNQPFSGLLTTNTFSLTGNNIGAITLENGSVITNLSLLNNTSLATLAYGTASINTIDIDTNQTTFTITGTNGNISLTGAQFSNLTVHAVNAVVDVTNTASTLTADLLVNSITFDGAPLTTLNLVGTSAISTLAVVNSSSINLINTFDAAIEVLTVNTTNSSFTLYGDNTLDTTISGNLFTSITAQVATNTLAINSSRFGGLNLNVIANNVTVNGNYTGLTLNAASIVNTLGISSGSMTAFVGNNADIETLNITSTSANLNASGSNITLLNVEDDIATLDLDLALSTTVNIISTTGVSITTNTETLSLESNGDSSVTSTVLDTITFNLGTNDLSLTLNKALLNVTLDGNGATVTLNGASINNVYTTFNTDVTTLILNNLNVSNLNFTTGVVNNVDITTTLTSINVNGDEVETITLTGASLDTITVSSNNVNAIVTINSSAVNLTLNGTILNNTTITNNFLTTLSFGTFTTKDLILQANSLSTFNVGDVVSGTLTVNSIQSTFNLSGNASTVVYNGPNNGAINYTTDVTTLSLDALNTETITVTANNLNNIIVDSDDVDAIFTLNSSNATLSVSGDIPNRTILNNDSLSTLTFTGYSTNELFLQTNSLNSLDLGAQVSTLVNITSNQTLFTITSDVNTLTFNGPASGTLDVTSTTMTNLNTDSEILILDVSSNDLSVTATSLVNLSGTVQSMTLGATSASLSLDVIASGTVSIDNNIFTTLTINNNANIVTLDIASTSLTSLDTNAAVITTLNIQLENNNTTITTLSNTLNFTTTGTSIATINYEGGNPLAADFTSFDQVQLNVLSGEIVTVTGTVDSATITGNNVTTLTTTSFIVTTTLTVTDTLISDLEFVSNDIITNVDNIVVNTLSTSNMASIINKLNGSTIALTSPITDTDVYNYYFNLEQTNLTDQEAIDNVRYNQFRSDAIDNAWSVIVANQYMDHLPMQSTKDNEIDLQTYQSVDDYYNSYLVNDGINEGDLTQIEIDAIKASIQGVLDDPALTFSVADINLLVSNSIDDDADIYAINEQSGLTFTIS